MGPVYSGRWPDANAGIAPLHNRMPVFLFENEWDTWLHGSFDDLIAFQKRKFPDEAVEMDRRCGCRRKPRLVPPLNCQ